MRRATAIALRAFLLGLLLAVLYGCGADARSSRQAVNRETPTKDAAGPSRGIEIDHYINCDWWEFTAAWRSYPILADIADITGISEKISIPSGSGAERVNMMIASRTLPDLISIGNGDSLLARFQNDTLSYTYDELVEAYDPTFRKDVPDILWEYSRHTDGRVYGLPCYFVRDVSKLGCFAYNVRKNMYEELGSPDMSTVSGFVEALREFKRRHPLIDGRTSIPFSLHDPWYRFGVENSFGVLDFHLDSEGKVQSRYKDPAYRDVVRFLNMLYREGLLDQQQFLKNTARFSEDLASGRVFAVTVNWWDLDEVNCALEAREEGSHFVAIEPLQSTESVTFPGLFRLGWMYTFITRQTEYPKEIIEYLHFMFSMEGNLLANYGYEGTHYTLTDQTVRRAPDLAARWNADWIDTARATGISAMRLYYFPYYEEALSESEDRANTRRLAEKYGRDNTVLSHNMTPAGTSEEGIVNQLVTEAVERAFPRMIMAASQEDALSGLDTLIVNMEQVGLHRLEEYWTRQLKANIERFGLPAFLSDIPWLAAAQGGN